MPYAMHERVSEQVPRFAYVSQAVAHIAGAKLSLNGLGGLQVGVVEKQIAFDLIVEIVEGGSVA
ncbi:hypothetical protein [Limnohabitans sp. 2KL-3]|uniref:hypothetical protein n=1 Tax=Limnohabitans sp. 2KL-3 TaxID=1100700 RepID=UPI000AE51166|nr:hypothetical protein [Limnohabitans sp. 2KL-3]